MLSKHVQSTKKMDGVLHLCYILKRICRAGCLFLLNFITIIFLLRELKVDQLSILDTNRFFGGLED